MEGCERSRPLTANRAQVSHFSLQKLLSETVTQLECAQAKFAKEIVVCKL